MTRLALVSSALLLVGAGLVQGQSISSQCQSTLFGIAGNPEASCLNPGGLLPILSTPANTSLVPALTSWLAGLCGEDPCSNQTLSDIVTNVTTGCGSDLNSIVGLSNDTSTTQDIIAAVQEGYPTVRDIGCLKDTTNNTLCATSMLDDLESVLGPLSAGNIVIDIASLVTGQMTSVPSWIACSDCVKQAYNVFKTNEPELATATAVTGALQSVCGASFLDGTSPSEIVEGTGSAAPTGTSGSANSATALVSRDALIGISLSSLAAVFSAFLVLA